MGAAGREDGRPQGRDNQAEALLALRDFLLASCWLPIAWELAFGWQQCGNLRQAALLWARVATVTAEILPLSTSHVVATMEVSLAVAELIHVSGICQEFQEFLSSGARALL